MIILINRYFYLSQNKQIKHNKKKIKHKINLITKSFILPSISTQSDIKHSLIQIAKAKIYGVNINNYPLLQDYKEKYLEYVRKIKHKAKWRKSSERKKQDDESKQITEESNNNTNKKVNSSLPYITNSYIN